MPKITPHVCRHTYCYNMALSGMNPKTLQYLMGRSEIAVTMDVYNHVEFDDAKEELSKLKLVQWCSQSKKNVGKNFEFTNIV